LQQVRDGFADDFIVADYSLILAVNQIALAEGVALGKSLGIDPVLLHNVVNSSSGQCFLSLRVICEY
jgi:hypothetical protein